MTVERINPPTLLPPAENAYAHITRSTGSVSYRISGQVAVDVDGSDLCVDDIEGQTRACYESIGRALSHIKLGWSDVTHLLTFTTDIAAYSQIEAKVIAELFGEHPPAATVVQVTQLFSPTWLIEIQADAVSGY